MRISDWSSDVCSSDLHNAPEAGRHRRKGGRTSSPPRSIPPACLGGRALRPPLPLSVPSRRKKPRPGSNTTPHSGRDRYPHSPSSPRSEEHTSELQSLMRISYAVFCLKKKKCHIQLKTIHIRKNTTIIKHI